MDRREQTQSPAAELGSPEQHVRQIIQDAKTTADCRRITREWLQYLQPVFEKFQIDILPLRDELLQAAEDPAGFATVALQRLVPVFDRLRQDPKLVERVRRRAFVVQGGFTPVDTEDFFSYGIGNNQWAHIHVAPGETLSEDDKKRFFHNGLAHLAQLASADESILGIHATSPLVARAPRTMKKFGFTLDGPIGPDERAAWFANVSPDEKIGVAHMDREELIARYGNTGKL